VRAGDLGIGVLTISLQRGKNWSRPPSEIRDSWDCCGGLIRHDLAELHKATCASGHRRARRAAADIASLLQEAEISRAGNTGPGWSSPSITAGGRKSRAAAHSRCRRCGRRSPAPNAVTAELLSRYHRCAGLPILTSSSHQRRAAAVEFSAVAGRLIATVFCACLLAGFRPHDA